MESPDKFVAFLEQYLANYSDYTTSMEIERGASEYSDVCFGTADYLYNLAKTGEEKKIANVEDLLPFLKEKTIIMGNFDTTNQCHSIIMIPYNDRIFVIQSLGGIYGAYYETWYPEELVKELKKVAKGKTMRLFHFVDVIGENPTITFLVAKRKTLSKNLLPSLQVNKKKLDKFREAYLENLEVVDDELLEKLGLKINKPPDAYLKISQMSRRN